MGTRSAATQCQKGFEKFADFVALGVHRYLTGQAPVAQSSIASPNLWDSWK
jgi:uncharacterized MAPEG superfamily protein